MDRRVFRMAMLTIISAFILVLVIVYATNTEKINKLFGWGEKTADASMEAASDYDSTDDTQYGQQIGDNLDAFLYDQDFFDETEKIPSVVVIKKSSSASDNGASASSLDSDDHENGGTGMAVVGELINPEGYGLDPATLDGSLFEYNSQMPQTPPSGSTPPSMPAAGASAPGTPVGALPGN